MRHVGWEAKLEGYLAERARMRFRYGAHDCCIFAAGAVKAITGIDPMQSFRGYVGAERARAIVNEHGGLSALLEKVMRASRFSEIKLLCAQRGDVLYAEIGRPSIGICAGGSGIFTSTRGLHPVPLSSCLRAWRIA